MDNLLSETLGNDAMRCICVFVYMCVWLLVSVYVCPPLRCKVNLQVGSRNQLNLGHRVTGKQCQTWEIKLQFALFFIQTDKVKMSLLVLHSSNVCKAVYFFI